MLACTYSTQQTCCCRRSRTKQCQCIKMRDDTLKNFIFEGILSEQVCTLLLYQVSFYFCNLSPKLLFLPASILSSRVIFVSNTHTQIPTFCPFPHLYLIAHSLITILANSSDRLFNTSCNSRRYKVFKIYFPS